MCHSANKGKVGTDILWGRLSRKKTIVCKLNKEKTEA